MRALFDTLCTHACGAIKADLSQQELNWLLHPRGHIALLDLRRISIIVTRVRLVAGLFAVLTPLWIVLDVTTFPGNIWHGLVAARLAATFAFAAIVGSSWQTNNRRDAYRALALLLSVPTAFYVFSYQHMAQFHLQGLQEAFKDGYALLPFVMVAGLSIFPLTVLESVLFALPMLLAQVVATFLPGTFENWATMVAMSWLLILLGSVSMLSGVSQLAFMVVLVRDAIRDRMTGCFSRSSGEELLELQFILASRVKAPLTVAFIDLDHFKEINDGFGHEVGDHVLAAAANYVRKHLRAGDMLIRWGGEEFVVVMPNIVISQAVNALTRLKESGFGERPDGFPVTASIGIAERIEDGAVSWKQVVEKADARMYSAKQAGRNRIVPFVGNLGFALSGSAHESR